MIKQVWCFATPVLFLAHEENTIVCFTNNDS
jgi:hypothetical protein